jgi:nitrite reductase/ring-hydroxylating ferredoxin subunit
MKHDVCKQEELLPGEMRVVYINDKTPVVVGCNMKREYFAIRDVCPHQGARLSKGKLTWNTVSDEPCVYGVAQEGEILRCPWHSFDYDTKTGQCLADPQHLKVKTYTVTVEEGHILLVI